MERPVSIVNVGYRSTNYWVVSAGNQRILIDIGWPGTLGLLKANLKRMGVPLQEIRFALATHYHIDHAGLAEELKSEGVPLLVVDVQVEAIAMMKSWTKPQDGYVEINARDNRVISAAQSRQLLERLGISGEILHTPGHTDHCVSLLLDDGSAFTGDLPAPPLSWDNPAARTSWALLRKKGAVRIFPAHGPIWSLAESENLPYPS